MDVYENPRKRGARRRRKARRGKRRSGFLAKLVGSTKRRSRRSRRKNPFRLRRRGGGGGGRAAGIVGVARQALPIVGGFWAADFLTKLGADRIEFFGSKNYGRQLLAGAAAVLLLMFGRRIPYSRPLAAGMVGWAAFSGLARAGFSGYSTANRLMPAGASGPLAGYDDDLDGLGIVGQPSYLGDGTGPGNLLGLGEPQAMLFGLGAVDDTYGGRA